MKYYKSEHLKDDREDKESEVKDKSFQREIVYMRVEGILRMW